MYNLSPNKAHEIISTSIVLFMLNDGFLKNEVARFPGFHLIDNATLNVNKSVWTYSICVQLLAFCCNRWINSLRLRQNRRHFVDDAFKCNFLNENVWIPIKIWLKFVPKGLINNIAALVQIMAWRRTGDKPLSEPMMTQFNDAYMRHSASMSWLHAAK